MAGWTRDARPHTGHVKLHVAPLQAGVGCTCRQDLFEFVRTPHKPLLSTQALHPRAVEIAIDTR